MMSPLLLEDNAPILLLTCVTIRTHTCA